MENRFGFKDFVMVLLLVVIIVLVVLAMVDFNRQYALIRGLGRQFDEQKSVQARLEKQLMTIQTTLESGQIQLGTASNGSQGAPQPEADPFEGIREAHNHADYAQGDWLIDAFGASVARITPLISGDAYGSAIQNRVQETLADRDPNTFEWRPLLAKSWKVDKNLDEWQAYIDEHIHDPFTLGELLDEYAEARTNSAAAITAFKKSTDLSLDTPVQLETSGGPAAVADMLVLDDAKLAALGEAIDPAAADYIRQRLAKGRTPAELSNRPDAPWAVKVIFQVRKGVMFSNGTPLTADDFAYTWEMINNPALDCPRQRNILRDLIRSIQATDEYEVTVTFKQPSFEYFAYAGDFSPMSRRFYSKFTPDEINDKPGLLLGTGPYRMKDPESWTPGSPLILYRNERYWGPTPSFDRLVYKEISNDVARLTEFRNGDIDRFTSEPSQFVVLKDDPTILAKAEPYNFSSPTAGYTYIAWPQKRNGKPTLFADKRVRQAMTMLIDRQRLVDEILKGYGQVTTGPFNPLSKQYDHDIKPWSYDPAGAKALLKEAGFVDRDGDGIIDSPEGKPFRFELIYPSGGDRWTRTALLVKDTLAQAGVIVDAKPLEWSVFVDKLKSGDVDAIALGWTGGIETDVYQMFHSDNIGHGADNFVYYRNPELDALITRARITLDEDARMAIWNQIHAILHEDQPYTFLYTGQALLFLDKRISNVERTRVGLNEIYQWYVPKPLQRH